jgi:hypothetical protein
MPRSRLSIILLPVIVIFCILASAVVSSRFHYPLGRARLSPLTQFTVLDLTGTLAGTRRIAADIAWVQLLQYYGSPEKPMDKDTQFKLSIDMTKYLAGIPVEKTICHEKGCHDESHYHPAIDGGVYPLISKYCIRVTNLDPFFYQVYLYGAGALAWNLNRPEEAVQLLQTGIANLDSYEQNISNDPAYPFWQLNLYTAAIIYRKKGEFDKMTSLLEVAVRQPQCPNLVKSILANIYQRQGARSALAKSLKLWIDIYDSGDKTYTERSTQKITELRAKLGI